jgi:hypothetical protein
MVRISSRELGNDMAGVLRRVQAGEAETLRTTQADPALRDSLAELSGGPDDLAPIV